MAVVKGATALNVKNSDGSIQHNRKIDANHLRLLVETRLGGFPADPGGHPGSQHPGEITCPGIRYVQFLGRELHQDVDSLDDLLGLLETPPS